MDLLRERIDLILDGRQPYPWGLSIGWTRGVIDAVFRRNQVPGPEFLAKLALAERASLSWLLCGAGPPYQVLPAPHWDRLPLGPEVSYYLFASDGGLQLPLVQVCRNVGSYPTIRVYSGLPVDFVDSLEYLHRTRQPLYYAPDHPKVAEVRKGWGSNRLLLGDEDQPGLLPEPDIYRDITEKLPRLVLQEHNGTYLVNPEPSKTDDEREWIWALRSMKKDDQALLLALVKRLGGEKD